MKITRVLNGKYPQPCIGSICDAGFGPIYHFPCMVALNRMHFMLNFDRFYVNYWHSIDLHPYIGSIIAFEASFQGKKRELKSDHAVWSYGLL